MKVSIDIETDSAHKLNQIIKNVEQNSLTKSYKSIELILLKLKSVNPDSVLLSEKWQILTLQMIFLKKSHGRLINDYYMNVEEQFTNENDNIKSVEIWEKILQLEEREPFVKDTFRRDSINKIESTLSTPTISTSSMKKKNKSLNNKSKRQTLEEKTTTDAEISLIQVKSNNLDSEKIKSIKNCIKCLKISK